MLDTLYCDQRSLFSRGALMAMQCNKLSLRMYIISSSVFIVDHRNIKREPFPPALISTAPNHLTIMLPSKPYSPPLVTSPLRNDQHTHTIILLHGRGSNGDRLGHVFIEATGIAKRFPTTKFIFPTATKRRPIVLKQIPINQWFDNYTLEGPNTRTDLQLDGLEKSSEFLRKLIEEEAALLSNNLAIGDRYSRVVIGRLSEGCAASVFCLLGGSPSAEKKPFGGVIVFFYHQQHDLFLGMSGWLPFEREIAGLLKIDEGDQGKSE